jgi:general stress protein 26
MDWSEVVAAGEAISWVTAFGTTGADGRAHVSFVAPGFGSDGHLYVATRPGSRKAINVSENPHVSMHWPVAGGGPGELFIRGTASLHGEAAERQAIWERGGFRWDLEQFFTGGITDPDLVFVDVAVSYARLLDGAGRHSWRPS